jgi:hypothetical protein
VIGRIAAAAEHCGYRVPESLAAVGEIPRRRVGAVADLMHRADQLVAEHMAAAAAQRRIEEVHQ